MCLRYCQFLSFLSTMIKDRKAELKAKFPNLSDSDIQRILDIEGQPVWDMNKWYACISAMALKDMKLFKK